MIKVDSKKKVVVETGYGAFPCVFEPETDMGGYAVEARGVQGAVSWGKTFAEAKRMIKEAIEGAIEAGVVVKVEKQGLFQIRSGRQAMPAI